MSRAPWASPRILTTLLAVFLSGAAAGAVAMRFTVSPERHKPVWKEGGREITLQRFKKDLDLTSDQAQEMERILDDYMMYYQSLQAQMDDMRATGKQRIMAMLSKDQQERFDKMIGELQAKQLR